MYDPSLSESELLIAAKAAARIAAMALKAAVPDLF